MTSGEPEIKEELRGERIPIAALEEIQSKLEEREQQMKLYKFQYDLTNQEITCNCNLHPTNVSKEESDWLWASNNKYKEVAPERAGKWILSVPNADVNHSWLRVKEAVTQGELWQAKVSTGSTANYILMVYTFDYNDVDDVTKILGYLETSGLKPRHSISKYETETCDAASIYYTNLQNILTSSLYSSDTIRSDSNRTKIELSKDYNLFNYLFWYNSRTKKIMNDCKLHPADVAEEESSALWAISTKHGSWNCDPDKSGKWMLFVPRKQVNAKWDKIKRAILNGNLWQSKVTTRKSKEKEHAIMIWTKDYTNIADVIQTHAFIKMSGLAPTTRIIKYKTDFHTWAGLKASNSGMAWLYSSDNISLQYAKSKLNKFKDLNCCFNCRLNPQSIVNDCSLKPSITNKFTWLFAINDKYTNYNHHKTGKWVLYISSRNVDHVWNQIKIAVEQGSLWRAKVKSSALRDRQNMYVVLVYTIDYTDEEDIIRTLHYLNISGIKPPQNIYYTKEGPTTSFSTKFWMYSSETITAPDDVNHFFTYNLNRGQIIDDCNLLPTEANLTENSPYLSAENNKYTEFNWNNIGNWTLFIDDVNINIKWTRIKDAIMEGHLWNARVSISGAQDGMFVVTIFTIDYKNATDVFETLDYLQRSGIKPDHTIVEYKPSMQIRAPDCSEAWIYTSESISDVSYIFKFDMRTKEVIYECKVNPTDVSRIKRHWLVAENINHVNYNTNNMGLWTLFIPSADVNGIWKQIKIAIQDNRLWRSKVSTFAENKPTHALHVYTRDYYDKNDAIRILDYLDSSEIKKADQIIEYFRHGEKDHKPIYTSITIRDREDTSWHRECQTSNTASRHNERRAKASQHVLPKK